MPKRLKVERIRGRSGRRVGMREVRQRFLIVCEGEQTEPNYFKAFQVPGLVVTTESVHERGEHLVAKAEHLRTEGDYDQVWCVFDRDDLLPRQITAALQRAQMNDIRVAFSNQAFELWYLLHFDFHNVSITRHNYHNHLHRKIGEVYTKNRAVMYDLLLDKQTIAINNARRLLALYPHRRPADDDPSTTVHELVEALNKHRRP